MQVMLVGPLSIVYIPMHADSSSLSCCLGLMQLQRYDPSLLVHLWPGAAHFGGVAAHSFISSRSRNIPNTKDNGRKQHAKQKNTATI